MQRLEGRSGGAEDYRHVGALSAHDGKIARGISEATLVLFERSVMLFVDNNDSEVRDGGENRRAGAKDDAGVAAERLTPSDQSLMIG